MGGTGTAEDEGIRLAHRELVPRCHLSQAQCRNNRRRCNEHDGNANGSPRVGMGLSAVKCWDPAAALGTDLEPGGWRGDEQWDFLFLFFSGQHMMSCPVPHLGTCEQTRRSPVALGLMAIPGDSKNWTKMETGVHPDVHKPGQRFLLLLLVSL